MSSKMTDEAVLAHIQTLVAEEEALYGRGEPSDADQARLRTINVALDQCWDLLRQRRALREFGQDPDQAAIRPGSVVEKYSG